MYEDGIDGDTLKEVLETAIKRIDIGTAVLPEPLFINSTDDNTDGDDDTGENESCFREGRVPEDVVVPGPTTRYGRTVRTEFTAVVIEHHLKWAPLCISEPGPFPPGAEEASSSRLGRYDFHHVDAMVDWSLQHNLKVKGHVLVWHVTSYVCLYTERMVLVYILFIVTHSHGTNNTPSYNY